ncbi:hypothetical protein DL897_04355 [Thermoflavimicrobium daqui]|uniref:Uncharacterized protein n=1 Tax=Thermoflavimicrobium daqui TaxID=2137476 RepID=A0A364K7F7_9BACL|nr:hypothetical protein DL897_04355 [Thermoflavimicrobium daqui]
MFIFFWYQGHDMINSIEIIGLKRIRWRKPKKIGFPLVLLNDQHLKLNRLVANNKKTLKMTWKLDYFIFR